MMKILVVENEPIIAQALKLLLANAVGEVVAGVEIAYDRATGLGLAVENTYDLLVLDGLWPGNDGHSLGQTLRSHGLQTPILLLTNPQEAAQAQAVAAATARLVKPFDAADLLASVKTLLGPSFRKNAGDSTSGDSTFDQGRAPVHSPAPLPADQSCDRCDPQQLERSLQAAEIKLGQILDSAIAAVISFRVFENSDWEYDYFSSGCETLLGYPPEAFMADKQLWRSRLHPDDLETLNTYLFVDLFAERSARWEYRFYHRDGAIRWLSCTYASQKIAAGCWQITVVGQDITDRKHLEAAQAQAEASLQAAHQQVITIWESMTDAYVTLAPGWAIAYANPTALVTFCQLTGLEPEAIRDQSLWDVLPWLVGQPIEHHLRQAVVHQKPAHFEVLYEPTGYWFELHAYPSTAGLGVYFRNISARKYSEAERQRAEASLRASQQQFQQQLAEIEAIYQSAPIGLGVIDRELRFVRVNQRLAEINGCSVEAHLGRTVREVLPAVADPTEALLNQVLATGEPLLKREIVGETLAQPGVKRVWLKSFLPLREGDRTVAISIVCEEITSQKQAEIAFQRQIQQEYLLNDITEDIRQSLDLAAVLARAVERSRAVLESDRVVIFRLLGNGQGEVIAESVGSEFEPILASVIHDPCFSDRYIEAYRQGRVGAIDDLEQVNLEPCYADLLRRFQVKANLVVPILSGEGLPSDASQDDSAQNDGLWGLLIAHQCNAPRQWQPAEIALLKRIANKTSVAIQQSELYGQVVQELYKRERIQQVLQQSEARFRTLSAAAPIGIVQIDVNGNCIYTNARWQAIAGLSAEQSLGLGWLRGVHPDDRGWLTLAWQAYLQSHREGQSPAPGGDRISEFRLLTATGDIRWIEVAIAPIRTATGDSSGYVSTVEDITQRKEADRKIREQAALLDIASDAIFVRDLDHRLLYWNQGAERLYGWSAAEALDRPVHDLLRGDLSQLNYIMQTLYNQDEWRGELHEMTKTGQAVTVAARWTLVYDEAGQPRFILSVETDITEKKILEAQFYQAQRLESLGRLSSTIAHDLNNMLTPILTMAQLLRFTQPDLSDSAQEQLRLLEDSAKRGTSMVQQILSMTRSNSGACADVDLPPLLQDLSRLLKQSLPQHITLQQAGFEPGAALPYVSTDPTHLHQVLMNLCVNARDAMPEGGTLTLSAQPVTVDAATAATTLNAQAGQYVRLTVADTGTGIDPVVRDRIFDPFFTTKGQGQGTGLGLSTVLGLVKASGGFVQVDSTVGQGTAMHLYLPTLAIPPMSDRPPAACPTEPPSGQGELILVVDDDTSVQHAVRSVLDTYSYCTLVASSGPVALDLHTQHRPRLVLLDMMMPGMDGLTLIQCLRATQPNLPIIATSGLATYQPAALAAGARAFLPKPYNFRNLLETVSMLLR